MNLINIYNNRRTIYLFCRDENGHLQINTKANFFPYFYEPDQEGNCISYNGIPLRKVLVSEPRSVPKQRSVNSFEADILFTKRYMIDKIDTLTKCPIKYSFIDIEVLADELPNVQKAKHTVSCISVYNSFTKLIQTFYLPDYETEYKMLDEFIDYMKKEQFDLWLSWNVKFDYNYLYNRIPDFAEKISIIGKSRYGDGDVFYPAGISIVDYLGWFKKVTLNRDKSYALDKVAQKHLKEEHYEIPEFGKLSIEVKNKNRHDIERMVKLEEKFKIIPYFDEVRRLAKVEWEDMIWNSRTIDMLLLQEAKNQKVALPMKPDERRGTLSEKEEFEGAYRCFSKDTEILTKDGWKKYNELTLGEKIATFNANKEVIEFSKLQHLFYYEVKNLELYNFKNRYTNQLLTYNHKILYKHINYRRFDKYPWNIWRTDIASQVNTSKYMFPLIINGIEKKKEYLISDELIKIHAWVITEGTNKRGKNRLKNNFYILSQSIKSNPKLCKEIDSLFNKLKWKIKRSINNKTGEIKWYINTDYSQQIKLEKNWKIIPLWMLKKLSKRQLNILYKELLKGDGWNSRERYSATDKLARDRFQYLCCLIGLYSNQIKNNKDISIKNLKFTGYTHKKIIKYSGIIWCPTVTNGFVVMRRDGKTFISGNSAYKTGAHFNIGKYDLTSAYPFAIIDFCLDPANAKEQKEKNTIQIENTYFKQNEQALLPIVVKKLMTVKNDIKKKLSTLALESEEYKDTKTKYDAIKTIVNSAYGVFGNRFFRLYDKRVASATTFIVRDLLHYIKDKIEAQGYEVIYVDTDSVFIASEENLTERLNEFIREWAKIKYNKDTINIEFGYEGNFEKLLILTKCRYFGYLNKGKKGIEEEIKGVEAKRKDSTIFMKKFQRELIEKILAKLPKEDIIEWIKLQIETVKDTPLHEIAFPCKLARKPEEYKNVPIFLRALKNTPNFEKKVGEAFYYIFIKSEEYDIDLVEKELIMTYDKKGTEKGFKNLTLNRLNKAIEITDMDLKRKLDGEELTEKERLKKLEEKGLYKVEKIEIKGKTKDVIAFDEETSKNIKNVDWDRVIERNITMKLVTIFEAMKWDLSEVIQIELETKNRDKNQKSKPKTSKTTLISSPQPRNKEIINNTIARPKETQKQSKKAKIKEIETYYEE